MAYCFIAYNQENNEEIVQLLLKNIIKVSQVGLKILITLSYT